MKVLGRSFIPTVVATVIALAPLVARADTITMSVTYYTISETDQDMNDLASGVFNNEVQNNLGPDGLPVLNAATFGLYHKLFHCNSAPIRRDRER